ncbi:hypothetical protein EST38_g3410 [Candolleomyces aberdarensis]|uniref:Uncharacterized protein n=1 Tax=Candolleomyces aberdarensis TaxID=2316362 RepID=A0A4Q2DSB0_9AGAR|nr:hypothetical protein EST38_g3410 [Candolleomyces aberdarensis]
MESLVQELQDHIFDLFDLESGDDRTSLSALGRTSKQLVFPTQRRLFNSIFLHPKGDDDHVALRRTKELINLTSPNGGSPHLLTYIKKVDYTNAAASLSLSEKERIRMEQECLTFDRLVAGLQATHTLLITFTPASEESPPDTPFTEDDGEVQDVQGPIFLALSAIPNLTALHVRHALFYPLPAIRWNSLKSVCLNAITLDFEKISRVLFMVDASGTAGQPRGLDPNFPVSPIEELRINLNLSSDISEFTDWILGVCRLKNLRYLGVQQLSHAITSPLAGDRDLHESLQRLLSECEDTLEELAIDMPRSE